MAEVIDIDLGSLDNNVIELKWVIIDVNHILIQEAY